MSAPGNPIVHTVMLDCTNPDRLVPFWTELLGVEEATRFPGYVWLKPLPAGGPSLAFQKVPDPKTAKNRMHMDLQVDDIETFVTRVIDLGGTRVADHEISGFQWTVLADPEGNEFCAVPRVQG